MATINTKRLNHKTVELMIFDRKDNFTFTMETNLRYTVKSDPFNEAILIEFSEPLTNAIRLKEMIGEWEFYSGKDEKVSISLVLNKGEWRYIVNHISGKTLTILLYRKRYR